MDRCRQIGPADRGDIVLGWLTKVAVVMALLGVVGFDLVSMGAGRLRAEDDAQSAVRAAVTSFKADKDLQTAYEAALAHVTEEGAVGSTIAPESFSVTPDGAVTLTLQHTAPTLVVEKVPQVRSWATASATVTGRPAL